uniref:Uncharacterized protein n=1 Tax=Equus asinus TaxID=9793 RepID=A0A9L0J1H8_EQUAS
MNFRRIKLNIFLSSQSRLIISICEIMSTDQGSSTCPKITVDPPGLKSSTTTLVDQNASDEEAQGINGRTPAKHSAASPKPQGTLIGDF